MIEVSGTYFASLKYSMNTWPYNTKVCKVAKKNTQINGVFNLSDICNFFCHGLIHNVLRYKPSAW